ncbi:MAG: exodeoxyribonuclease VII large subunit [Pseudomonadales bacterium]|nr:exodeoxyribonuclease VII large subunit [Pseudomonadales bacterium]MBO6596339.1 exodeoxyribonuclease VII large subunit [Pseudomonadales bacterium]MBO6702950.1 exodeoxyribonuclease VII large subunit [Pseudomonadales bacterium]MBO6822819.1 exodeoxyribonuclease VII large subunit [Pseudomonadales bacterium]MBO7006461.1 exodeoxyribonuclease VII large subunit [Pseudomonadales bacterium]
MTSANRQVITVSELNRDAKHLLESEFPVLHVEGEISNLAQPSSGHWYFTLKDDKAQVRCAMFRNRNHMVRFKPRNGQQIVVRGRISLYEGRGEFQMIADSLEDSGEGALRRAYENLKRRLQEEGLFDASRKKPIPTLAEHIAIVTSPSGAAIRDVITVMRRRFPAVRISILPVQVQGDDSVPQIVEALSKANARRQDPFELILLTRGGGSLEDLWSFNTEPVARAVASSELPVVCAVGHESDVSIADFVADLRAPTPSAAAELITPDGSVLEDSVDYLRQRLVQSILQNLEDQTREVTHLQRRLRHPNTRLEDLAQRLDETERRLRASVTRILSEKRSQLGQARLVSPNAVVDAGKLKLQVLSEKLTATELAARKSVETRLANVAGKLDALSPLATLQRGYAIVSSEPDGRVITNASYVETGDRIRTRLQSGELIAEVTDKKTS